MIIGKLQEMDYDQVCKLLGRRKEDIENEWNNRSASSNRKRKMDSNKKDSNKKHRVKE